MCYRCTVCDQVVDKQPMKRWPLYRMVKTQVWNKLANVFDQVLHKQIEKELTVCAVCYKDLENGADVNSLIQAYRKSNPMQPEPEVVKVVMSRSTAKPKPVLLGGL